MIPISSWSTADKFLAVFAGACIILGVILLVAG